jgi:hypothetical protein
MKMMNMRKDEETMVRVTVGTREKIRRRIQYKGETYDAIINRLLEETEGDKD